jgi:hypothetical protein
MSNLVERRIKDIHEQEFRDRIHAHRYLTQYEKLKYDCAYKQEQYLTLMSMNNKNNLHIYALFRANVLGRNEYFTGEANYVCTLCEAITQDITKHLYCTCASIAHDRKRVFGTVSIQNRDYNKALHVINDSYMLKVTKLLKAIERKIQNK